MKIPHLLLSVLALIPPIVIAIFAPVIAPIWLVPPAIVFVGLLAAVLLLVRVFGLALGLLMRVIVWVAAWAMILAASYAIVAAPVHSLLAWIVMAVAVSALTATPPPSRGARLAR